jgi:hypothetical protein
LSSDSEQATNKSWVSTNRHQPDWPTQPSDSANHNISQSQQIPAFPPRRTTLSVADTNHSSTIGRRAKKQKGLDKGNLNIFGAPADRSALSKHIQRIYNKENRGAWYIVVGVGVVVVCSVYCSVREKRAIRVLYSLYNSNLAVQSVPGLYDYG